RTHRAVTSPSGSYDLLVSASCRQDEQLVGGAFAADDVFEYAAFVLASYPSSPTTWTVHARSISGFGLTATAYWLQGAGDIGVRIMEGSVSGGGTARVACPDATARISGGYSGDQPVASSYPIDGGWAIVSPDPAARVYALCAARRFHAAAIASVTF